MLQVNPNESFPIVRQLSDPLDVNTYYVLATIYDGRTNAVLGTVKLTNVTGQLFQGVYQAPGDSSGQGHWISINTEVFTAANYTSPSPNYEIENTMVLVQQRVNNGMIGAGGDSFDYGLIDKRMRTAITEIVAELLGKAMETIPRPKNGVKSDEIREIVAEHIGSISKGMGGLATMKDVTKVIGDMTTSLTAHYEGKHQELRKNFEDSLEPIRKTLRYGIAGVRETAQETTPTQAPKTFMGLPEAKPRKQYTSEDFDLARKLHRQGVSHEKILEQINR